MTATKVETLGDHVELISGFAFASERFSSSAECIPLVRIRDVVRGYSDTGYAGHYDPAYLVDDGDILIGMDGEFNAACWKGGKALLNQRVCRLKPRPSLDGRYLLHFLPLALKKIESETPFVTVKHLSSKTIKQIPILIPALDEQRRLAAILDQAEAMQAKRRQSLAKLDTFPTAIYKGMFGDPVSNSLLLPTLRVEQLCHLVRGSSPRPQGDGRYYGGDVPRLMVADVTRDGWLVTPTIDSLTIAGAALSRPVSKGTVVMAVSGNVGVVSQLAVDACIHDGFVGFTCLKDKVIHPLFLVVTLHLLKETHTQRKAGAIFQNLTTTDIKSMSLPIPPLIEQLLFAERMQQFSALRTQVDRSALDLKSLSSQLQHRALKGEL